MENRGFAVIRDCGVNRFNTEFWHRERMGGLAQESQPDLDGSAAHDGARPLVPAALTESTAEGAAKNLTDTKRPELQRRINAERRDAQKVQQKARYGLIPNDWYLMALVVLAPLASGMLVSFNFAPWPTIVTAIIAAAIAASSRKLVAWERAEERPKHLVAVAVSFTVFLPILLASFAQSYWLQYGTLDWRWGVGVLISFNAFTSTLLSRRLPILFMAILCAWAPVCVMDGSFEAMASLGAAAAVLVVVARHQLLLAKKAASRREEQRRHHNRFRSMLNEYEDAGLGWFWETDRRGLLSYVSPRVAKTLGRSQKELLGKPFLQIFNLGEDRQEGERTLTFHMSARSSFHELPVRAARIDEERWWSVSGRPMYDSFQNFVGFRGSGTDLTEKKRSQENASRLAHYDSLTGLANRFQMAQSLEKILAAPHETQRECAIFLLDLDRFKQVNDSMGHPAGDALLKQVAQRLEATVGKLGRVGRLGGDEFEILIPGREEPEKLANLAHEIIGSLSQPYSIDGQRVVIGASLGIARSPANGVTSEALIRNSDLALYAAKDGGRGRYHFYSNDLHSAAEERSELESDLRDAISQGGLELFYQPVVLTATEQIAGFEALLRWNHPKQGWISPARFVPIAEDAGLIGAIGEWALRTACHDLAKWPENVRCAVNVSALQFANPQLPAIVTSALAQNGIHPSRLELEITESVFLNDDEGTDAMFAALKGVGVRLALDDFGTGYSSLGYLKKAPFDKIKIDQSFVRGATEPGSRNGAIIASITSLAHALGMDTTAEGVETLDELDLVRMHGCSHIQGYIYEKALSADAAFERLESGLQALAKGPRSARASRQTMLRKIVLDHDGQFYNGTIRNISTTGALVEGLWNVPVGTIFTIALSETQTVTATTRWCTKDRMGIEFANPVKLSAAGKVLGGEVAQRSIRKAG
ncbi:EAL domain-containing protein [Altererythrobacter sp. ZODW24]|uniref:EAL domain-containing protein n=1 Tax=Altererythrobacter sp. ZODW24 TaxID=2185142 RepID=UPI001F083F35|nr:EAL domain-containing protein [Altererythrobacter sp. ZODW24]